MQLHCKCYYVIFAIVKSFIKIFAFYLIGVSFVPCGDGDGGILEVANQLFKLDHNHVSNHDKHSKDCGDDTCTVFCICSCCSTMLELPSEYPLEIVLTDPPFTETLSLHPILYKSIFLASIWQPPKFC